MKPQDLDKLEKRADEQAAETRVSTSRAASVLSKFQITSNQKRKLLDQYAAQDVALAKSKKAAKGA